MDCQFTVLRQERGPQIYRAKAGTWGAVAALLRERGKQKLHDRRVISIKSDTAWRQERGELRIQLLRRMKLAALPHSRRMN